MQLDLYQWNGNESRLERPSLREILEFGQPFALTLPQKSSQRVPEVAVMGNWNCSWFSTWPGIRIIDHAQKNTYLLSQHDFSDGKRAFTTQSGIINEWSSDKYSSRANWYTLQGEYPKEIFDEFKNLGFDF